MVFYGRKTQSSQNNQLQYKSIRQEILREIEQRNLPKEEKSIASIFSNLGNVVFTITQNIINAPQNIKTTQMYQLYQIDKQTFKQQMKPTVQSYKQMPTIITQNKFYLINKFTIDQRLLFLNSSVYLFSLFAASFTKGYMSKIRCLLGTSIIGYSLGGLLIVPEIFNSLFDKNII